MEQSFGKTIKESGLFHEEDQVLIGLSGGPDSVALLLALNSLKEEMGLELLAVHVNHHLRENAESEAGFVRALCEKYRLPLIVKDVDVKARMKETKESIEEAARALRYRAFFEVHRETGFRRLALAHHKDDQAETILFQMIRGSALNGLAGMKPLRYFGERPEERNLLILRPLLPVSKKEILQYLSERGQDYCRDESNEEDLVARNKMRHHVLPALCEIREDSVEKIVGAGQYFGEVDRYLRKVSDEWLNENAVITTENEVRIPKKKFQTLDRVIQEYCVMEAIRSAGFPAKDITRKNIASMISLCDKQVGKTVTAPGGISAQSDYENILLRRGDMGECDDGPEYSFIARVFPNEPGLSIPEKEYTKWFDYDKINGPLVIRKKQEGDRFSTFPGTHKKLKDYLIDEKIPKEERGKLSLLAVGSDVLWIIGGRMSEDYKVTAETKEIIGITVFRED